MSTPVVVPNSIALQTVELVSTLRPAPENGAPSSADYFSGEQEKLIDLTTLESFLNNVLLPILNALPAEAAAGLEGTALYFDTSSQDILSYNSLTNEYLVVTDTIRLLYGMIQNLQISQADNALNISSLQQRLSSSNQNDISLTLQTMTQRIISQAGEINNLQQTVSNLQLLTGPSSGTSVATPSIAALATETVAVLWDIPFQDNTYIVTTGLQDDSGFLRVTGFSYLPAGAGILVRVMNTDTAATHQGTVNVMGRIVLGGSSGDQDDTSLTLQVLTHQIELLQSTVSSLVLTGAMVAATAITPVISVLGTETVAVLWDTPFPDNFYTVAYGIQDASGYLRVTGFTYLPSGIGVLVNVENTDSVSAHQGAVNVMGRVSDL